MKATGIVRRIDDLGRIVLPKEIRKSLKIKEGDMLEIYVKDNGIIVLEKYEPMEGLMSLANKYAEVLANLTNFTICITTDNHIIASAGKSKKEYIKKDLSDDAINVLADRIVWSTKKETAIDIIKNDSRAEYISQIIVPIIDEGDLVGGIIVISKDKNHVISDSDIVLIKLTASLLLKNME